MVNAFATNISKTPLMPLYIYVNLNTVFRVLEMSNYSLNLMFAIMRYVSHLRSTNLSFPSLLVAALLAVRFENSFRSVSSGDANERNRVGTDPE